MKRTLAGLLGLCLSATTAAADSNLMFILDASNSMWGQVDGTAKIQTAKASLMALMSDLPKDTRVGLMAYGHNDKESCTDVQMMVPVGSASASTVKPVLDALTPKGKTPIAYALEQSASGFGADEGANNNIVLISDGIETCEGDPCAAAEKLAASNIGVKVHVVGFDISDKDRAALECIAEKGKGKYFAANSTEDFKAAITEATVVAQAPKVEAAPPPPPPAQARSAFEDHFEGRELAGHWTIENEDKNAYVVEDSNLLLLVSGKSGFGEKDTKNLVKLKTELPNGDWDLVADVKTEFGTGRDILWLGVHESESEFIAAAVWSNYGNPDHCAVVDIGIIKRTGSEESRFDKRVTGTASCGYGKDKSVTPTLKEMTDRGGQLILSKRGRKYSASYVAAGGEPVSTDELSVIRLKGDPAIAVGQWEARKGETLAFIDKISIIGK